MTYRRHWSVLLIAVVAVLSTLLSGVVGAPAHASPGATANGRTATAPVAPPGNALAHSSPVTAPTSPPTTASRLVGAPSPGAIGSQYRLPNFPTAPGQSHLVGPLAQSAAGLLPILSGAANNSSSEPKACNGIWPAPNSINNTTSQQTYASYECYGHDEPGIEFYSALPGSAGNVSWNVTLPVDRSPILNQSNLYSAIWFGMTLADPYATFGSCFLELQFYPDSSWFAPGPSNPADTVYGQWVARAVAWQIEYASGYEDPCYISPLYLHGNFGSAFLNMSQGDHILVNMTGWVGNPAGEMINVTDVTNGQWSTVSLYNRTGDYANEYGENTNYVQGTPLYPLNPAYSTNNFQNSLMWTPGGELPVGFAFEVGHAGNPDFPATNPYGGCSPGGPGVPDSPCPSYDAGSWINYTASPWQIAVPTYFNGSVRETPSQVAFAQDIGAKLFVNDATGAALNTACVDKFATAWCNYPWYTYSCTEQAFNFGATDWAATSADFGQADQYQYNSAVDTGGLGFFPVSNFSVPTCGNPSYTVTVGSSGGGTATFLTQAYTAATAVSGIGPGNYSVHATASAGTFFTNWSTTGLVTATDPSSPYTNLLVSGTGSATANFGTVDNTTSVTFTSAQTGGSVETVPGFLISNAASSHHASGSSANLAPGVYTILGVAPVGYNFTSWSVNSSTVVVAAPYNTLTWMVVPAGGGSVTLTAHFKSTTLSYIFAAGIYTGSGTVNFAGHGAVTVLTQYTVSLGGYSIVAAPAAGYSFAGWVYYYLSTQTTGLLGATAYLDLEYGPSGYYTGMLAEFVPAVTFDDNAASDGGIALYSLNFLPVSSGTTVFLTAGTYTIAASPAHGFQFSDWTVSNSADLWAETPNVAVTLFDVNHTATVTANYVPATVNDTVWFNDTPATGGLILFNYQTYPNGASNASVVPGVYPLYVFLNYGYTILGATAAGILYPGPIAGTVQVNASATSAVGWLNVSYTPVDVAVTFEGLGVASIGSAQLTPGTSTNVLDGVYTLSLAAPGGGTFTTWSTQGNVSVGSLTSISTTITVTGPGTVTAWVTPAPFVLGAVSITPSTTVTVGSTVDISVAVTSGTGPFSYLWSAIPGCSPAGASFSCTPSATGRFSVDVNVTDGIGDSILAAPVTLTVLAQFAITSFHVAPTTISLGGSVNVQVLVQGGSTPLSFAYSGMGGCSSATTASFSCTPSAAGTFNYSVTVTDATSRSVNAYLTVVVNPALAASLTASKTALTVGVSTVLTTTALHGTAPYTYAYASLPLGCLSANFSALDCRPTASGVTTVTVTVTDNGGATATAQVQITVNPTPAVTLTVSAASVTSGSAVTLTTQVQGGTAPFSYSYSGLPSDCQSVNDSTLTCTSHQIATFTVTVEVTDADLVQKTASAQFAVTSSGGGGGGGAGSLGGLSTTDWALIAVVIAVVIVAAVLLTRRRAPPAPAPAPTMSAESPSPPPSGAGTPSGGTSGGSDETIYGGGNPGS